MTQLMSKIVKKELEIRDELSSEVLAIILQGFPRSNGNVRRGTVQEYAWTKMGFEGRCGNSFRRFVNKIMAENGFRCGYSNGLRVYYGIKIGA